LSYIFLDLKIKITTIKAVFEKQAQASAWARLYLGPALHILATLYLHQYFFIEGKNGFSWLDVH
jgi:hypothetical protein